MDKGWRAILTRRPKLVYPEPEFTERTKTGGSFSFEKTRSVFQSEVFAVFQAAIREKVGNGQEKVIRSHSDSHSDL